VESPRAADDLPGVPLQGERRSWRRFIGALLAIYGLVGLTLLAGGAVLVDRTLGEVDRSTGSLEEQRDLLVRSLRTTADTFGDAATGLEGFDTSIGRARESTGRAAGLARDVSATMAELARTMGLNILGTQPLLPLAAGFDRAAAQLTTLGGDLDAIGTALDQNSADAAITRENLESLHEQVDILATSVEDTDLPSLPAETLGTLRLVAMLLLGWLGLLAIATLTVGLWLLAPGGRRIL
jgi:methyl-accepting chemotaxis protein